MSAERLPLGKECTKCGEWKLLEEFHRWAAGRDGRTCACKSCNNAYQRRYHEKNRVRNLEYHRRYREENCEKVRESKRRYHEENRVRNLERQRRYREENREKEQERVRRHHEENPEQLLERSRRRRAREVNAEGNFTAKEFRQLCKDYGSVCLCCGESEQLTADHVIPLSKGGSNNISNIQPLCKPCNSRKGTKTTDYRPLFDKDIEELGETG